MAPGPNPATAHHLCGATGSSLGPFSIQTYEDRNYKTTYARTFELAGFNALFPEYPSFALQRLEVGSRAAGSGQTADPYIPPVLLKAIAFMESAWAHADYSVPYGGVGPTLVSHDCGYGIAQVTTGMQNISGIPNLDQAMIGSHYAFNIARGARILAEKWNLAPDHRPQVGLREPELIENWYYAIWGYNGFAFVNHPLNPSYSPTRPPFSCGPQDDGFGHDRTQYPYQELILGCAARPPVRGGTQLWPPQPAHLPNLGDPAFAAPLSPDHWNGCAYSLQCAAMDMPTPNTSNRDGTVLNVTRSQVLGSPSLAVSPTQIDLLANAGTAGVSRSVTISNGQTGVLPFRAISTASWLKVSSSAGVALGTDLGSVPGTLTLSANLAGLAPGGYGAQVKVETLLGSTTPVFINVSLTVRATFDGQREIGDFNGDGRDDVIFLCCDDTVSVWMAGESGSFGTSRFSPWPGYNVQSGRWGVGDFNGDGRDDLLHMCCEQTTMVWRSRGDGVFDVYPFSAGANYPHGSGGQWLPGDFNNDGRDDFVHTCCGDTLYLWAGRTDGTFSVLPFSPWAGYSVGSGSWKSGDFNGDGATDLLHLCCSDYAHSWISKGDGTFEIGFVQAWPGYGMQGTVWEVADFDGDGKDDLAHICCANYSHIWYSVNGHSYDVRIFKPWDGYQAQVGFWLTGDLNADGVADLLHMCCPDYVHPWFGRARGAFNPTFYQPWPGYGIRTATWETGDFNGDGRTDLLHFCCNYAHGWISTGDGNFGIYAQYP